MWLACAGGRLRAQDFVHPGIPLTVADLDAVKTKVLAGDQPWRAGYEALSAAGQSQLTYTMQGPFTEVGRNIDGTGVHINLNQWRNDMVAVWNLSRMWYFTRDDRYAQKARDILVAWAQTQTVFSGRESSLDLGDYAFRFVGGADILRGTWPGWTDSDTTLIKGLFNNVYWPATTVNDTEILGPANKGTLALVSAGLIALFNDDRAKLDMVIRQVRGHPACGLINILPTGQIGESGRDQGHAYGQWLSLTMLAEALWKQGIDLYSELDDRLLAAGEYHARVNLLGPTTPYVPYGTIDAYYINPIEGGWPGSRLGANLIHGAYVVRKGLPAPFTEMKRRVQTTNSDSFMFEKTADNSTASSLPPFTAPASQSVTTGLVNATIGTATPAGSTSYSNGIWTVRGAGQDIWGTGNDSAHFSYRTVSGDFEIAARVDSVQAVAFGTKAGLMMRQSLAADSPAVWIAITPVQTCDVGFTGWSNLWGGTNRAHYSRPINQSAWWVKIARVGKSVTTYASPDGTSWAALNHAEYANLSDTVNLGLVVSSLKNGTLATATFSQVRVTGGDGGAPVVAPAAPLALLASPDDGRVALRWTASAGATAYQVKRAAASGGPYTVIATVSGTRHTDTTVSNDVAYRYVVTATNTAGVSPSTPEQTVTPRPAYIESARNGFASASSGTGSAPSAFDGDPTSAWTNDNAGPAGWLAYDLGVGRGRIVRAYELVSGGDTGSPARAPRDWTFDGSNDGAAWTVLDTCVGEDFHGYITTPVRRHLQAGVAAAYRYYRLNITANNGDASALQLADFSLLTVPADLPALPSPTALVATSGSAHRIELAWAPAPGASGYTVLRAAAPDGPFSPLTTGLTSTTFSDRGLDAGDVYYYVVIATNETGASPASVVVSAMPVSTAIGVNFVGGGSTNGTPSGLGVAESAGVACLPRWINVTGASGSRASLSTHDGRTTSASMTWSANNTWSLPITEEAGGARLMKGYLDTTNTSTTSVSVTGLPSIFTQFGYRVLVYCDGHNGSGAKTGRYTLGGVTLSATDAGNANYSGVFTRALNSAGNYLLFDGPAATAFTLTATGTTTDSGPRAPVNAIQIVALTPAPQPAAPTGLAAAVSSASRVDLTWNASAEAMSYTVKRSAAAAGPFVTLATAVNSTTFSDSNLPVGSSWYYVVVAVNNAGESPPTSSVAATTRTLVQQWRIGFFGTDSDSGSAADIADPDGDGVANLLEYALGANPTRADASVLPTLELATEEDRLALVFDRIADPALVYQVEASSNLSLPWNVIWTSTAEDNTLGPVQVLDVEPLSAQPRRFLRLRVTR